MSILDSSSKMYIPVWKKEEYMLNEKLSLNTYKNVNSMDKFTSLSSIFKMVVSQSCTNDIWIQFDQYTIIHTHQQTIRFSESGKSL